MIKKEQTKEAIEGARCIAKTEGIDIAACPPCTENPAFLTQQLITYIGNKRALLSFIGSSITAVQKRLAKEKLVTFDVFSGSGIVARYLKRFSSAVFANDLELYSALINRCYLANNSQVPHQTLRALYADLSARLTTDSLRGGFISELYAPKNDDSIQKDERVFYTARNARYIDTARTLIEDLPREVQHYFIAPLLSEASIHANTSGVFKGFYKDGATGIGSFGGAKGDALTRIKGEIRLPYPIFSNFECDWHVYNEDANTLAPNVRGVDLAYIDPPYNQHPYGSNYFMLNVIARYQKPSDISAVSGIPRDWNRSRYNKSKETAAALSHLIDDLDAKFVLVSFNSEGFITNEEMTALLKRRGTVTQIETPYNAFRGSRNLRNRPIRLTEYLYLLEKS